MNLLDRIKKADGNSLNKKYFILDVNGINVGFVDTLFLDDLEKRNDIFTINTKQKTVSILFKETLKKAKEKQINSFFKDYFKKIGKLDKWRDELYSVSKNHKLKELLAIERSTLSYLGITGYGVHINGFCKKNGTLYMWIAKRSKNKQTEPGKLDQIAAGGIPHDISVFDNVIKECDEEAKIPKEIAVNAKFVSTMQYWKELKIGVRPDTIFNYDLELPVDFKPIPNDGEVESFELMCIDEILERIQKTTDFKFNSELVIIEFAIRHNLINNLKNSDEIKEAIKNLIVK